MATVLDTLRSQPVLVLSVLVVLLVLLSALLVVRTSRLQIRLQQARAAAEDAARAATLAAPGGIDPDIVVDLLRHGEQPTLDRVYATMLEREDAQQRRRRRASV